MRNIHRGSDRFDFESYVGARVTCGDDFSGSIGFASAKKVEPDSRSSSKAFMKLVSRWVSHEVRRQESNRRIKRLSRALNESLDAVFITDLDGTIEYVNQGFEQITGYHQKDILGENPRILQSGEHDDEFFKGLWETISSGHEFRSVVINETRSEEMIHCDETIRPVIENGEITHYVASFKDVTDLKDTEAALESALEQKNLLLHEVHHRVTNNVGIISSMLELQEQRVEAPEAVEPLRDTVNRIRSMSRIHELPYQSEQLESLDLEEYFQEILNHLEKTYRQSVQENEFIVNSDVENFDLDTAIPCGVIITELVANSMKHGYSPRDSPFISVKCTTFEDEYRLVVSDDGCGYPESFSPEQSSGLGFKL